jgi:Tfp pilus assembly protein FimV
MNTSPALSARLPAPLSALALALVLLTPLQGLQAQTTDAAHASEHNAMGFAPYTTAAGDTLEKIASRQYAGSPLNMGLLVQHLQQANAEVLGKASARQRIKTGTVLRLPEHARLVQLSLTPFLAAQPDPSHAGHSPEARRRWVHYP